MIIASTCSTESSVELKKQAADDVDYHSCTKVREGLASCTAYSGHSYGTVFTEISLLADTTHKP